MKYEMIFGDEKLFDGAPWDSVCVERFINHELVSVYVHYRTIDALLNTLIEREAVSCASNRPDIAMRRIIPEPKRWTKADQLEGKLPPIGSKYIAGGDKRELTCLFHGKGNGTIRIIGFDSDDEVTGFEIQYCHPIESPEEKAQRLRSEWCNRAMDYSTIQQLYDAILSGDLPVPVKDEKNEY